MLSSPSSLICLTATFNYHPQSSLLLRRTIRSIVLRHPHPYHHNHPRSCVGRLVSFPMHSEPVVCCSMAVPTTSTPIRCCMVYYQLCTRCPQSLQHSPTVHMVVACWSKDMDDGAMLGFGALSCSASGGSRALSSSGMRPTPREVERQPVRRSRSATMRSVSSCARMRAAQQA